MDPQGSAGTGWHSGYDRHGFAHITPSAPDYVVSRPTEPITACPELSKIPTPGLLSRWSPTDGQQTSGGSDNLCGDSVALYYVADMAVGGEDPEERDAASERLALERPFLWLTMRTITLIGQLLTKLLDRAVVIVAILALVVGHLIYVAMLPPKLRAGAPLLSSIGEAIGQVSGSGWFAWGGWILLVLVLVPVTIFVTVQDKRIRDQGKELAQLRSAANPRRLSSHDSKALADYHREAQERFAGELAEQESEDGDDG